MTKPRYIEWTDERGALHVFDTVPLEFPAPKPLPEHPFEARRYLDHADVVTTDTCWCHATASHPIHAVPSTA